MNVLFKTIVASLFLGIEDGLQSNCFSSDHITFNTLQTGSMCLSIPVRTRIVYILLKFPLSRTLTFCKVYTLCPLYNCICTITITAVVLGIGEGIQKLWSGLAVRVIFDQQWFSITW